MAAEDGDTRAFVPEDALAPPAPSPLRPWHKVLQGGFAVAYVSLAVILAGAEHELPLADRFYPTVKPVRLALGLGQSWHMFSTPPKWVSTLSVEVLQSNGAWAPSPPVSGPQPGPVRWRNWRGGKEEEFQRKDDYAWLLQLRTESLCRASEATGAGILGARFPVHKVRVTRPGDRVAGPPFPERETRDEVLGPFWCDR